MSERICIVQQGQDQDKFKMEVGPDTPQKYDFCSIQTKNGQWSYINIGETAVTTPLSLIDGELAISLKVDTRCPATFDKNAKAVLTTPSEADLKGSLGMVDVREFSDNKFVASPGCTNEESTLRVAECNFKIDSSSIINVKLSDLFKLSNELREYGIYFDARLLSHLIAIDDKKQEEVVERLNNSSTSDDSTYSFDNVVSKIKDIADSNQCEYIKETKVPGRFLEKNEVTTADGEVISYASRPHPDGTEGIHFEPKVALALTFVCDQDSNIYMVVNKENRPPMLGKRTVACPAGLVDKGENVSKAITRELSEETGIQQERSKLLGYFSSSPDGIAETYGGGICVRPVDIGKLGELGEKIDSARADDISYIPNNTDGGITESVNLVKIGREDAVTDIVDNLKNYGELNSQSIALLYMLSNANPRERIYDVISNML